MNKASRTKNVARNVTVSLICQALNILLQFVGRTIFIYVLGKEYLGVNGLFTNILTMLSFAELGIGNAMVFSMYKPLSTGDTHKLQSIMKLYRKSYIIIGIVVAGLGLCVIPFLDQMIGKTPDIPESITLIYILYLANSASSYFFVYKKSIIIADQRQYIVNIYQEITGFIQLILQSVILFLTKNFLLYLLIQIVCTLFNNVWTAHKANKLYPFLKEKAEDLSKEEKKGIFSNVSSLALYKFGSAILNGTDNIIISYMFSIVFVGMVSNYVMIINMCTTILSKVTSSFTASIGNLNAEGNPEKQYRVFVKMLFLSVWIFGFASFGMMLFLNDFIDLWVGEDYVLPYITLLSLVLSFYVSSVQFATYTYRTTLGLFRQGRFAPIIAALVNIAASIFLAKLIGLSGIFFATAISRFFVITLVDVQLVYRLGFHKKPIKYYGMYFGYLIIIIGVYLLSRAILSFIDLTGVVGLIVKVIVASVIYNGVFLLVFGKTSMFKEIIKSFLSLFLRKKKG